MYFFMHVEVGGGFTELEEFDMSLQVFLCKTGNTA